jgi:hypothetical protein
MMRLASQLIANADFPCGFAAPVVLASMAENIAELHYAPVYRRAVTSSSLSTSPSKTEG